MEAKIGILGGLGPEATADLFKRIIKATPAKTDQEHIQTIIYSNPKIPDRTQAIVYGGESPLPEMTKTAKALDALNVNIILIPCNTAHYFHKELQETISTPILHMIEETAQHIKENYPHVKNVGLLATTGTIRSGIYAKALAKYGLQAIIPDEDVQENFVMEAIYGTKGIKAGYKQKPRTLLKYAAMKLDQAGADILIKGCTEVALVLNEKNCEQSLVDPANVAAQRAVEIAQEGQHHIARKEGEGTTEQTSERT